MSHRNISSVCEARPRGGLYDVPFLVVHEQPIKGYPIVWYRAGKFRLITNGIPDHRRARTTGQGLYGLLPMSRREGGA